MASTEVVTPTLAPVSAPVADAAATPTRQMDPTNLKTYLHRLAEKCAPGMRISDESMVAANAVCLSLAKRLVRTADAIVICRGNQRLSVKEIQTAAVSLNETQLVLEANLFATEAVNRYDPNILNKPERGSNSPSSPPDSSPAQPTQSASQTQSTQSTQPASHPAFQIQSTQPASQTSSQAATPAQSPSGPTATGERRRAVSRSTRANLTLDVARVDAMIRSLTQSDRISEGTPVYLAAFLEHIAAELLRSAATVVVRDRIHTIKARHIITAVESHTELKRLNAEWLLCDAKIDE